MQVTLEKMEHDDLAPPSPVLDSVGWRYHGGRGGGAGGLGLLSLFDYKEHGVVDEIKSPPPLLLRLDAIIPTRNSTRTTCSAHHGRRASAHGQRGVAGLAPSLVPPPAPDGPHVLIRPLWEGGVINNNNHHNRSTWYE